MPTEPTPYIRPEVEEPSGHPLVRGIRALLLERRLPYRVSVKLDRLCRAVGITRKTVKAGGCRVRVRRATVDEEFVQNVLVGNEYTPPGFEIHETDVVIDIGANVGTFALMAATRARLGRVFSYEPNQENFDLLVHNVALNRLTNVSLFHAAVSGRRGQVKLFCSSEGGFHSVLSDRAADLARYELVDALTLADIFDTQRIERCNFLKLDCEGAEHEILHNCPEEYLCRINKIVMEYHGDVDATTRRGESDALVRRLEDTGFRIEAYEEFVGFRGGFIRAMR